MKWFGYFKMATFLDFRHVVSLCTFCTLAHASTTRSTSPLQRLFGRLRGLAGDQLDAEAPWKASKSTGTWPSNELLVAMALAQNQTPALVNTVGPELIRIYNKHPLNLGVLPSLNSPQLEKPLVFLLSRGLDFCQVRWLCFTLDLEVWPWASE